MTTKREEWMWDGFGGLLVDGQKVAQLVPGSGDVGRRIAAVPDMEAELLEVRHLLSLVADGDPEWHRGGKVQKRLEGVTAALRKAGRLP